MRYKVLDSFKAQTTQGEMVLQEGQIVNLPDTLAVKLIQKGRVTPFETLSVPSWLEKLSDSEREIFQERSAIMEYDGGLSKEDAEKYGWCFQVCMLTETMSKLCERMKPCPKWN